MKSIGARLAICYVLASTVTFASLFLAGRYFIEHHAIHALDLLNQSEFEQIRAAGAPLGAKPSEAELRQRVQAMMSDNLELFFTEIYGPGSTVVFRSPDLRGRDIAPSPQRQAFNANVEGLGELRAGKFALGPYTVVVATTKEHVRVVMSAYEHTFYGLLLVMIAISSVIGYGFSRMALRPLRLIQDTADRIRSDNLSERIPVSGARDEISDLARLLNQMFDRLEASFDQIRRFTAEASHELKTPLTLVRLQAEKLVVDGQLTSAQEHAVQIQIREVAQLNRIIEDLLFLSRADARAITLDLRPQDPEPFLHSFAEDAHVLAEHREQRFFLTHHGGGRVAIEPKWIRQVLLNLLSNALAASPPGSRVTLRSTLMNQCWQVRLEDEGPGVAPEQRERIFERFVRFHRPGSEDKGSGLGLAICRSLVELHGGRIFAEAGSGGRGLSMVFEIPATTPADGAGDAPLNAPFHSTDAA
ncbi:two-component sensor histidine kinase [Burkholderia pyrrocinia]|uniref:histidine kinase n=1 Tax=Burkholderia pyrrocinia TaxID=60550 RepID=A0A2Z5N8H1_BURPY|nr:ATP-binding protein [Burkholderia pyrrocinia]AXF25912.1 two-component sensor histidine kinase [Burkholderia pyrrocinia]